MRIRTILTLLATSLVSASCQTAAADQPGEFRIVRLEHAQATSMAQTLSKLAAGGELAITAVAAPEQNALLLRGSEELIAQTLTLIARLDVADRDADSAAASQLAESLVIYCRHCKAQELAATVQQLLPKADQLAGASRVTVIAHPEHNALLISGPSDRLTQVRKLVEKLDRKAS